MAITVYSLIKHQGPEVKRYFAEKKGGVSATYIRKALKKWKTDIQPKLDIEEEVLDVETRLKPQPIKTETISLTVKRKVTVTELLTGAFDNLNKITSSDKGLSGTDWAIVERIETVLERIRDAD